MTVGGVKKICREKMMWIALPTGRGLRYKSEKKKSKKTLTVILYLLYN